MGPIYDTALLNALGHTSEADLLRKLHVHDARTQCSDRVILLCVVAIIGILAFSVMMSVERVATDADLNRADLNRADLAAIAADHSSRP